MARRAESEMSERPIDLAIRELARRGHIIQPTDMPGFYRIDGGPELTTNQLIDIAIQELRRELLADA